MNIKQIKTVLMNTEKKVTKTQGVKVTNSIEEKLAKLDFAGKTNLLNKAVGFDAKLERFCSQKFEIPSLFTEKGIREFIAKEDKFETDKTTKLAIIEAALSDNIELSVSKKEVSFMAFPLTKEQSEALQVSLNAYRLHLQKLRLAVVTFARAYLTKHGIETEVTEI
jgi:hypothetical protein